MFKAIVVFVDAGMMLSFDQLASVLGTRGVHTVHLTRAANPLSLVSSRLVYDRTGTFTTPQDLLARLQELDVESVADIQCPEFLAEEVLAAAIAAGVPESALVRLRNRLLWRDKYQATRALEAHGVPVPEHVLLSEADDTEIGERLGFPLVLKRRVGSGGEGVRVVRDADDLAGSFHELGVDREQVYAEAFEAGETLCWAATFADGSVCDQVVYRTLQHCEAEGPSSTIEVVDDTEVSAVGARVSELFGGVGLVNLDLVRDADGAPRVIDVNLRAWHSVVALAGVGHHFADSYLEALGLLPRGMTRFDQARTGQVNVFPDQSDQDLQRSRAAGLRRFMHDLSGQRDVLPVRYRLAQTILFARRAIGPREELVGELGQGLAA